MLIVLAVIGTLAALAFPALRKPLAKHQLRAAAKQLRAEMARTRLKAIENGESLQFIYVPGTGTYRVEPLDAAQRMGSRSASNDIAFGDGLGQDFRTSQEQTDSLIETVSDNGEPEEERKDLPEDIRFASADEESDGLDEWDLENDTELDASNLLERSEFSGDLDFLAPEDWSSPIVFYPNGRTSNAVIELVGERDYRIRLTVRGVTGAIFISKLERPPQELEVELSAEPPPRLARRPARSTERSRSSPSQSLFRGSIHGIQTNRAPAAQ